MSRHGLLKSDIISTAISLVEEKGFYNFSLRDLAKKLNIQAPSLYNHFSGIEEINNAIAIQIESDLNQVLLRSIQNKNKDDAIRALGHAQLCFACEHPELYRVIIALPQLKHPSAKQAATETAFPAYSIIHQYDLDENTVIHLHRMFRSMLHGFITLSQAGYLTHRELTTEESFSASLEYFIQLIHVLENKKEEN